MDYPLPDWLDVSRETHEKLIVYCQEIIRWNKTINLVSKSSLTDLWSRHILDSAQIYGLGQGGLWMDIGSGGGLPGMVVSIMGAQDVVLVESDLRKSTFLRQTARVLGLNIRVLNQRIESIPPMQANTVSARALAPLSNLLGYAQNHLVPDGVAVFPKGRLAAEELAEASLQWRFDVTSHASVTDPTASVLVLKNIVKI